MDEVEEGEAGGALRAAALQLPARGRLLLCLQLVPPLVLKLSLSLLPTPLFPAQPQRVRKAPLPNLRHDRWSPSPPPPCGEVGEEGQLMLAGLDRRSRRRNKNWRRSARHRRLRRC